MDFLALFVSLPTRQTAGRMRIWRALRALGCATLRDGVYLLPDSGKHVAALDEVAAEVRAAQGMADVFLLGGRDESQQAAIIALFDRATDYAALLATMGRTDGNDGKALRGLKRDLAALVAIDYFPGEAQRQARAALAALEAAANGEPATTAGEIRRLASADFQGRTWATRKNLWVDRMASAWLIRRFIDRKAKFLWLDNPKKCPKAALGFDFDGAAFTHVGGRVSFEVLAASFGLDADPALSQIAAIVHCLDVGGVPVAEAAGVEAVLAGLRAASEDDDKLLTAAARVFDGLYQHFQQEPTNG
ncbi:MAG: chromate resistance protein [Sterolibacteriaceae bacterium]|nr:chromate resistance protein [Sterolibacteriaceae bacterium]